VAAHSVSESAHLPPFATGTAERRIERRGPGRLLPHELGPYSLFDHIGRGGMADIYRARTTTSLGAARQVVIKEVLPELCDAPRFSELLVAEAKLASGLSHANIVTIEHLGRDNGTLYIAMEYVEGLDLRELLRRCARQKVPLPVEFSLLMVSEILRALDYAHRHPHAGGVGIIHRDVSPSNVLLSFDGEVKMCDFGIAIAHDAAAEVCADAIEGKAGYMSPEHARGKALDPRSDVFSAGVILWELLSGKRLYRAKRGESLLDVAARGAIPPLALRGLEREEDLVAIVNRALARRKRDRYSSAAAMLRDLEAYVVRSGQMSSSLRFGAWLTESFAADIVKERRAREKAVEALAAGPVAVLLPIRTATAAPKSANMMGAVSSRKKTDSSSEGGDDMPPSLAATSSDVDTPSPPPPEEASSPRIVFILMAVIVLVGFLVYMLRP
jgi:eukaryotic-like serine/threonine-protein kinase